MELAARQPIEKAGRSSKSKKPPLKQSLNGAPALTDALKTRLFDLRKGGFNRLYQAGEVYEFSTPESLLDINFAEPVFVLVDRLVVSAKARTRVVDAIETAYREAGEVIFEIPSPREEQPRTTVCGLRSGLSARTCNLRYEEPEPRLFSFNNPYGACPRCQGFGNTIDFDLDLVIPDKMKTIADCPIEPWTKPKYRPLFTDLKRYAKQAGIPLDVPWADLEGEHKNLVLNGEGKVSGGAWILQSPGAQEIQAARARVSQPLSRIFAVSGLQRVAAAAGGAAGQGQREKHLRGLRAYRRRRAAIL